MAPRIMGPVNTETPPDRFRVGHLLGDSLFVIRADRSINDGYAITCLQQRRGQRQQTHGCAQWRAIVPGIEEYDLVLHCHPSLSNLPERARDAWHPRLVSPPASSVSNGDESTVPPENRRSRGRAASGQAR